MKQSISSQVCDAIVDDIFNHTYQPGQILTERALIEAYGCSKTTVREALVALCQRQIVRSIPRCGYEILRVERSTITDILEYRYILETGCLRRCFGTITPRHILRLTELDETCCMRFSGWSAAPLPTFWNTATFWKPAVCAGASAPSPRGTSCG